jgi:hypothetical protein
VVLGRVLCRQIVATAYQTGELTLCAIDSFR